MQVNYDMSSEKPLYSFIVALLGRHVSFSHLHQMEGERKKKVVEPPLFGSLVDAIYQSL